MDKIGLRQVLPDVFADNPPVGSEIWRRDVTFDKGRVYLVEAASGSGKSSFCGYLYGYRRDYSGTILFDDRDIRELSVGEWSGLRCRSLAMMFQGLRLFPELSAVDNVRLKNNLTGRRSEAEIAWLFEALGIAEKRETSVSKLSFGQQQRVALARMLAARPGILLLDEPFSALDSYLKWNLELELTELLSGFRGPILMVSQDQGECCRNCQKVCVMENGVSSSVTDMETLVRHPATQSAAQLTGCRNFLPVRRCEGGVCLDGWDILLPLHAAGERATVSVPDGAITVEGGTHTSSVSRVIRDLNATAVELRAADAPDAPPQCVVLPEGVRAAEGDTLSFSLLADRCRLWEE